MRNLSRLLVFFEIFGCARQSSNKFGSALACTKISLFTKKLYWRALCKMQKKLFYKKMQRKEQKKRENGHEKGELYAILL